MNKKLTALVSGAATFAATSAHTALLSRLGGKAYCDDLLKITWLADAHYRQDIRLPINRRAPHG